MSIIAKEIKQEVDNGQFELFIPKTMLGADGKDVSVLQSIGHFSIDQLNREKASYQTQIDAINEKITAINDLSVVATK
jgi:hypothetical protein